MGASVALFVFLLLSFHFSKAAEEQFSEELFLRPLPDGKVLAHFHFVSSVSQGHNHHHRLFPKAIDQLMHKFSIRELELSFTHGRWDYKRWGAAGGVAPIAAKPIGAELSTWFDLPPWLVDDTWHDMAHALSGLFCASLNFLERPTERTSPVLVLRPDLPAVISDTEPRGPGPVLYGALPREAVCTENLTPWLKLLPCRDRAGLATLLDRPRLYKAHYHSLRTHIRASPRGSETHGPRWGGGTRSMVLEQTLTLVLSSGEEGVSLSGLFGRGVSHGCPVAGLSRVSVEVHEGVGLAGDPPSRRPTKLVNGSELLEFEISKARGIRPPLDVRLSKLGQVSLPQFSTPFQANRFLTGYGYERGGIVFNLERTSPPPPRGGGGPETPTPHVEVWLFQVAPWYVRVYLHTLAVQLDGRQVALSDVATAARTSPAEDRRAPGVIELQLMVPGNVSRLTLSMEFDKGYLRVDEHPPDANRGFDLPAAMLVFPGVKGGLGVVGSGGGAPHSPLLKRLQEPNPVRIYTEGLLVPLATPDFSMPYNVTTLTCTAIALMFGSLFNALLHRFEEEGEGAKAKAESPVGLGRGRPMDGKEVVDKVHRLLRLSRGFARSLAWGLSCGAGFSILEQAPS